MSKFKCLCDFVMTFQTDREEYVFTMVPDATIEDIGLLLSQEKLVTNEKFYDMIAETSIGIMRCPNCHRLWLEQEDHSYRSYIPEPEQ